MNDHDTVLAQLQAQVATQQTLIDMLRQVDDLNSANIRQQQVCISLLESRVEAQTQTLAAKDDRIATQAATIATQAATIATLEATIAAMRDTITLQTQVVDGLRRRLADHGLVLPAPPGLPKN